MKVDSCEMFHCNKRFFSYRCERGERSGGGVLIAVADTLVFYPIYPVTRLELLWVELRTCAKKLILGICYRPPSHSTTFVEELHDAVYTITIPNVPIVLIDDFNFPDIL